MTKHLLKERFQELAGIKSLGEQANPILELKENIDMATILSHDDYYNLYIDLDSLLPIVF